MNLLLYRFFVKYIVNLNAETQINMAKILQVLYCILQMAFSLTFEPHLSLISYFTPTSPTTTITPSPLLSAHIDTM